MADWVSSNGRSADYCPLHMDMGVHVKTPFATSATAAAPKRQEQHPSKAFTCEVATKEEGCGCRREETKGAAMGQGQTQQHGVWMMAALLCGVTVLFSVSYFGYVVRQSRAEMDELRQRVHRLEADAYARESYPPSAMQSTRQHPRTPLPATSVNDMKLPEERHSDDLAVLSAGQRPAVLHQGYRSPLSLKNGDDAHFYASDYAKDEGSTFVGAKSRHKRQAGNKKRQKKPKVCNNLDKCMQEKESGKPVKGKCKKLLDCLPPNDPPALAMKPVHFISNVSKRDRQREFGKEAPLPFDAEPRWMSELYRTQQPPIERDRNSGFLVKQSGVYFIYTSVMFHDIKPRQSQSVVVNGIKKMKCMDSVDFVNHTLAKDDQKKYKTCAISGLLHLNVNDRLEVQNLYAETEIDQAEDATYFGAILLLPLELTNT